LFGDIMKLKFSGDAVISGVVVYKTGETYEVSNEFGSASMWIKRGIAEEVFEELKIEIPVAIVEEVKPIEVEQSTEEALDVLGGQVGEEVAIVEVKADNKKGSKSKKGL
jgi:hypothetical protein